MDKLDKAYEAIALLENLGLTVSKDQTKAISDLEKEYLKTEVIPLIKSEMEPLVENIRDTFCIEFIHKKGEELKCHLVDMNPKTPNLFQDKEPEKKGKEKRFIIKVTFPDGHVSCEDKVLYTFIDVIEYAGIEKVESLNIKSVTGNLISRESTNNLKYINSQKILSNGFYVQTRSNSNAKLRIIKQINRLLNLDLKVEKIML